VGEEFPLERPNCGGDIQLIAFITEPGPIRKILTHLGEPLGQRLPKCHRPTFPSASDDRTLALRTTAGEIRLDREEIDEVITREQSVMPEGLWDGLTEAQVRDLVADLASPTQMPLPASE